MADPGPNDRDRLLSLEQKVGAWVRDFAATRDRQDAAILNLEDSDREIVEGIKQLLSLHQAGQIDLGHLVDELRSQSRSLSRIENDLAAMSDRVSSLDDFASAYQIKECEVKQKANGKLASYLVAIITTCILGLYSFSAYDRKQEPSIAIVIPCLFLIAGSLGVVVDPSVVGALVVKK